LFRITQFHCANITQGLLSRRAWGPHGDRKMLGAFALGVVWTLCILLIAAMLLFGPQILEMIDGDAN